jgi:hypothetical protein
VIFIGLAPESSDNFATQDWRQELARENAGNGTDFLANLSFALANGRTGDVKELTAHSKARTPVTKVSKVTKRKIGVLRQKPLHLGIGLGH